MIDKEDLRKSCFQLNLNLDDELLDSLFDYCDLDKDGLINYLEFANFLNWKDKMAVKEFEEKIITKGKWQHWEIVEMILFLQKLLKEHCWQSRCSFRGVGFRLYLILACNQQSLRYKCISEPWSSVLRADNVP